MAYSLDLEYSSAHWAEIVEHAGIPDVEVCVRVGKERHRYSFRDLKEIPVDSQNSTRKPRAFRIASLGKLLINLAFCIYLDKPRNPPVTFDTRAFGTHDWGARLQGDPTIRQLLLHLGAFADLNRLLLSPSGNFMFSNAEDFVKQAVLATNARANVPAYEYSSANHIFAALLLEKLTDGKEIDEILYEYIFHPFGMKHTTMSRDFLDNLVKSKEIELVRRYQRRDTLTQPQVIPEDYQYMSNTMEKVFLGAWSTVEDIEILFEQLMKAYHQTDSQINSFLSQGAAQKFFEVSEIHSLAGILTPLADELSLNESPNRHMRQGDQPLYKLNDILNKKDVHPEVYYKGSAATGVATTLCMGTKASIFVVVLANLAAPMDGTPHIANLFLQDIFSLGKPVEIAKIVRDEMESATALFTERCIEDRDASNWPSPNFQQFVGRYRGIANDQTITISPQQTMTFARDGVVSDSLSVRSNGNIVRLVPISFSFILDRHGSWSDVEFKMYQDGRGIELRTNKGRERYRKITAV